MSEKKKEKKKDIVEAEVIRTLNLCGVLLDGVIYRIWQVDAYSGDPNSGIRRATVAPRLLLVM